MRKVGLLGGMSWESTLIYYQLINQGVRTKMGGLNSAKILMNSYNFSEIAKLQGEGEWALLKNKFLDSIKVFEQEGIDFIVICTNTMHKLVPELKKETNIPFIHIVDATAESLKLKKIKKIGLLGTRFTMEEDFFKDKLKKDFDILTVIPEEQEIEIIHKIIYDELCQGEIKEESRQKFITIMEWLKKKGAQGIILGCTEINLLIKQTDIKMPLFDTTEIHCQKIVDLIVESKAS